MTYANEPDRDEVIEELRELVEGAFGLSFRRSAFGVRALTKGDWDAFEQSIDRAQEFLKFIDGPLRESQDSRQEGK
jgi:hypothetical protein